MRLTGLEHFGVYLTLLFEIDMLFGNENRHLNNIAVLRRGEGFDYCPLFDFGAGLLSNVRDYPMEIEPKALVRQLRAQPFDTTFARQVHAAEAAYGVQLEWDFDLRDIGAALAEPLRYYADAICLISVTAWRHASKCSRQSWSEDAMQDECKGRIIWGQQKGLKI